MLVLISPAKSLDFESAVAVKNTTQPEFPQHAAPIMEVLRRKSASELSDLMDLSEALAELNFGRNQQWKPSPDRNTTKPAVYAFQGDVYQGLDIDSFTAPQVRRCQKHVRILSGLYGLLKPLDHIQPYRLEMGTKLDDKLIPNLYQFWGETVRDAIVRHLAELKSRLVVNLASQEYARVAKLKSLNATVITPDFRDWKNDKFKVISFFAKRARGLMVRYLITQSITNPKSILSFDSDGYSFNAELSTDAAPVFTRRLTE